MSCWVLRTCVKNRFIVMHYTVQMFEKDHPQSTIAAHAMVDYMSDYMSECVIWLYCIFSIPRERTRVLSCGPKR